MLLYVDDPSVGTKHKEDYLKSLDNILGVLYENGVSFRLSKCSFRRVRSGSSRL